MRNLTVTDKLILNKKEGLSVAWLRRIIVSVGIGGVSYAIMFALMLLSVMYDHFSSGNLLGPSRGQSPSRAS